MNRKLQGEIDRTLKKVDEGIQEFEVIWQKVHTTPKANLKEKYEADLKKEIKKLQRYRDQIKSWCASNEVKNKAPLLNAKRRIEQDMERFKIAEKEAKTKAYSKEALERLREQKVEEDPEKVEMKEWIVEIQEQLRNTIDDREVEYERFGTAAKKRGRKSQFDKEKYDMLREHIDRLSWHVRQLDACLQKLDSDRITVDMLDYVKDDIEYYVSIVTNLHHDFSEDIVDDSYFYSMLEEENLLEENPRNDGFFDADERKKKEKSKKGSKGSLDSNPSVEEEVIGIQVSANYGSGSGRQSGKQSIDRPAQKGRKLSGRNQRPEKKKGKAPNQFASVVKKSPLSSREEHKPQPKPSPIPSYIVVTNERKVQPSTPERRQPSRLPMNQPDSSRLPSNPFGPQTDAFRGRRILQKPENPSRQESFSRPTPSKNIITGVPDREKDLPLDHFKMQFGNSSAPKINQAATGGPRLLRSKPQMRISEKDYRSMQEEHKYCLDMLDVSLKTLPEQSEIERSRSYTPRNPQETPNYFPSSPAPIFEDNSVFERFDIDTLFFIFYFQQGTYQQYLAAKQLKRQSWRYHKKYLTWFMRFDDPKLSTEDYEKGTYVYFDYDYSWCQRIKTDFTFEYNYLEDELDIE